MGCWSGVAFDSNKGKNLKEIIDCIHDKVDFLNKGDTLKSDGHGKEEDLKVYIGDKADATKKTSEGSIENIRYLNGQIAELSTIKVFSVNLEQPEDKKLTFRSKDGKPLPVYFIDVGYCVDGAAALARVFFTYFFLF